MFLGMGRSKTPKSKSGVFLVFCFLVSSASAPCAAALTAHAYAAATTGVTALESAVIALIP
jgi:hypothetical protein